MDDNQENLAQFVELTGASLEQAKNYLQISEGNVENAISLYWDSDGRLINTNQAAGSSASATAATNTVNTGSSNNIDALAANSSGLGDSTGYNSQYRSGIYQDEDEVRAPIASKRDVLVGGDDLNYGEFQSYGARNYFGRGTGSGFGGRTGREAMMDPFRNFEQETMGYDREGSGDENRREPSNLSDLFRPPIDLTYKGDLENAIEYAKSKRRYLIVNIQSITDFESQVLNRDLWSDTTLKEVIKENYVFCQYMSQTDSAEQIRQYYTVRSLPYIAIIDPRTGERMKSWGPKIDATLVLNQILQFMFDYPWDAEVEVERPETSNEVKRRESENNLRMTKKPKVENQSYIEISDDDGFEEYHSDLASENLDNEDERGREEQVEQEYKAKLGAEAGENDGNVEETENKQGKNEEEKEGEEQDEEMEGDSNVYRDISPQEYVEPLEAVVRSSPEEYTRIQIRFPKGEPKRRVNRYKKSELVNLVIANIKFQIGPNNYDTLEVTFNRKKLGERLGKTLAEADLCNSTIDVDY